MSGIFEKLSRTIKGLANDALDAAADPGRDARQIVRELEEQIQRAEAALLDVRAEYELMRSGKDKTEQEVARWDGLARQAISGGDEGLARECLTRKQQFTTTLQQQSEQIAQYEPAVRELESRINELKTQHAEMENRIELLEARSHLATAQEKTATAISGIGGQSLVADFDKLEAQVEKQEARASAASSMATQHNGNDLEQRVKALQHSDVDDALAKLKQEMGR